MILVLRVVVVVVVLVNALNMIVMNEIKNSEKILCEIKASKKKNEPKRHFTNKQEKGILKNKIGETKGFNRYFSERNANLDHICPGLQ